MHEFPEHLAVKGHQVGFVQFPEGLSKNQLLRTPHKQVIQGRVVKDTRLTLFTPKTGSGGLLGRLATVFSFGSQFKEILQDFKPDVIVSFAVPTSGWQALRVAKKGKTPFVFRALDVSHKIRKSIFAPLIEKAERFIYRNADWVSANNPAMLNYCLSMGAKKIKSSVDLPPLDLGHFDFDFDGQDVQVVRQSLGIPAGAKVALYMGSFFYFSGLPELIKSFAILRKPDEYLVLIGGGEQDQKLRALVSELEVEGLVKFTGFVGFDLLPAHLRLADVAVNPMQVSLVSNAAFPNKVIQYMAAGLPVVSTRLRGLAATFENESEIRFVDASSDVFLEVQEQFESGTLEAQGERNKKVVQQKFSIPKSIAAFESLLIKLSGEK
jgi:glycosyltransferase involved in cell wall biosynthesis